MDWSAIFLNPATLALMIPIVAIIAWGAVAISKMVIEHRERLAMIHSGMHPDLPVGPPAPPNAPRVP